VHRKVNGGDIERRALNKSPQWADGVAGVKAKDRRGGKPKEKDLEKSKINGGALPGNTKRDRVSQKVTVQGAGGQLAAICKAEKEGEGGLSGRKAVSTKVN